MFVAVCDQKRGNSTFRCSKAGPSLPGMIASRSSHSISSKGSRPGIVKKRPGATDAASSTTTLTTSSTQVVWSCCSLAVAISCPPLPPA
jgi:hypothetical protein